jgi:hypothetical protein
MFSPSRRQRRPLAPGREKPLIQRTTMSKHPVERPADSAGELYYPTPVTPEEAFQAIGRLRKDARDEIDRLIRFLDKTDDYVSRELEDSIDDNACDDDELDGPETAEDELSEPDEPSLGSLDGRTDQELWARGNSRDLEDEHDGAEPEDEGGCGAKEDDEPSLGWPERLRQDYASNGSQSGDDRELQNHGTVVPAENRSKLPGTIDVEDRGYGGHKIIRGLSEHQTTLMVESIDRDGTISIGQIRGVQ